MRLSRWALSGLILLGAASPGAQAQPATEAAVAPGATPVPGPAAPPAAAEFTLDASAFGGLTVRSIGTAVTGGRISALEAVPGSPLTVYVGAASGGVWKSIDGGLSFKPIFEDYPQSIGAIRVDPSNPKILWVGTGESWTRNSVSVGLGVYRSTDGGENWQNVGLKDSERIADILVHPKKSDTAWVCATGHLWNSSEERGVYKTTDAGKTWKRVLYVNADTGCADMDIDPEEPDVLYASMWQFRRKPWAFSSGGPGSGLYRSTDGGETWKQVKAGLPDGDLGRIAVAVAPSRPSVVYANVESKTTALYRSQDLGETWTKMNDAFGLQVRPFYFSALTVDPTDYNYVYKPGLRLSISTDGGQTFSGLFGGDGGGGTHGDVHVVWVDPKDPQHLLLGDDGGLWISHDRGHHWRHAQALPISQFYHVTVDMEEPYNVYGGLQDNGSWMGPSRSSNGIMNGQWRNVGGSDGFCAFRDPLEKDFVYAEGQGGKLTRMSLKTGEQRDIQPFAGKDDPKYRFNWNTPFLAAPDNSGTLYVGAQFLFRSKDHGETWEKISPDLTTNDKDKQKQGESGGLNVDDSSAENHCTIYTIAPSPKDPQVLWVGTDDGNVQLTRDGGKTWTSLVSKVPGLPPNTWVSSIEAGRHDPAVAYATFDGHRLGDMKPYVFKTTDYGQTWKPLASDAIESYVHVLRQDLVKPDLLFLGSEMGLYVSLDDGQHWVRFGEKFPRVPVMDITIHPRDADLVLATHGRGVMIVDDITPLRGLSAEVLGSEATLLPSRPAQMTVPSSEWKLASDADFVGATLDEVAPIVYYQKKRHVFGDLKLEVYDAQGKLVTTLPASKRAGINRVPWPMRLKPPMVPAANKLDFGSVFGPRVAEGKYTVKLIKGKNTYTTEVQLVADPRSTASAEDRALQQKTAMRLYDMLGDLTYVVESVADVRDQAKARAAALSKGDDAGKAATAFADELEAFRKTLVATSAGGWISSEQELRENLGELYGGVANLDGRPTRSQLDRVEVLSAELDAAKAKFEAFKGAKLTEVNRRLTGKKQAALKVLSREEWTKKQEGQ
jgi:photosystem II stability/assembly factor-like uncharacterized protein